MTEYELPLPSWVNSEESYARKGKLLYIEKWGLKGRFKDWGLVALSIILAAISIIVPSYIFILILTGVESNDLFFLIIFVVLGWMSIRLFEEASWMPFCVYENGITKVVVGLTKGLTRTEIFVPWNIIQNFELGSYNYKGNPRDTLQVHLVEDSKFSLSHIQLSDPYSVFKLIDEYAPGKLSYKLERFIVDETNSNIVVKNTEKQNVGIFLKVFSSIICLMLLSLMWTLLNNDQIWGVVLFFGILLVLVYIIVFPIDKLHQEELYRNKAIISQNGISYPRTLIERFFLKNKGIITFLEVDSIQLTLNSVVYSHITEIITSSGQRVRVPLEVFCRATTIPGFHRQGDRFIKNRPVEFS